MSRRPEAVPGPRVRWVPLKPHTNDAEDALLLASAYGLTADPWQEDILHGWLGRRRDGKWCAGRCGLAVPRQNGKNAAIEIRELFGMVVLGEKILHTAHEVKTARKAFKRLLSFFDEDLGAPPELAAMVTEIRKTNGQEAIFLNNGGSVEIVARSKGSGRGYTCDVLILDEAQALTDDELEAIRSAVSSAPLGNPQVIYTGTPPNRDKGQAGEVWVRVRAGAEKDPRLCWIEYGAPDGPLPDLDDRMLLYATNPALELQHANGAFGLQMDVVIDERHELSPDGYARERLGWWGDPQTKNRGVISLKDWATCRIPDPGPPTRAQIVIDVAPDLAWTAIGLAAAGPLGRVLILEHHDAGTSWAVKKLLTLLENVEPLEVALTPTAQIFASDLTKAEVEYEQLSNAEVGRGCTAFQQWVKSEPPDEDAIPEPQKRGAKKKPWARIAHLGQTELDAAVQNARTRFMAGGVQHWDRRNPAIDLSPLVATSVAAERWVMKTAKPDVPPPPPRRARPAPAAAGSVASVGF